MSVIKNSSLELPNSITKGRLVIGNDKINYGPTSTSGYYSGVSVPENGYVFYRTTSGGKLNAFIANNDSELISMVTRISNTNITTVQDALNWLFNNSEYFIKNKEIPSIVSDNLLLYFDFGLLDCYPQSGNTLDSTTLYFSNGTLNNSPTYLSDFGGLFNFNDSLSQHATTSNIPSLQIWTIEVWFRLGASLNGKETAIMTRALSGGRANYAIGTLDAPNSYNLCVGFYNNTWRKTDGFIPDVDTWYHVVGTYDGTTIKQYVNGVFLNEFEDPDLPTTGFASDNYFMRRWDPFNNTAPTNYTNGDLAVVRVYNTALTASEVQKNYDAEKDRFTIPSTGVIQDQLFMELDASQYTSGLWTDLTGNGNNATINGATWSLTDGGIFDLDGTNDNIQIPHVSELSLSTTVQKTIQVWVKIDELPGSNVQVPILGKLSSSFGFDGYWAGLFSNGGVVRAVTNGTGVQRISNSTLTVTTNTWYLFTFISQITGTSNTTKVYINDTEYITNAHGNDGYNETNPLYLGYIGSGIGSTYLNGKIGACYFYTKGLSASEITDNFNNTKSRYGL